MEIVLSMYLYVVVYTATRQDWYSFERKGITI